MVTKPETPPGTRVYAIGDIHGRLDLLTDVREQIARDIHEHPAERALVVYLGDYVDRGPSSRGVVDLLIEQPLEGAQTICLKGNHEEFLLRFHESGDLGESWLMNGGGPTLASYGINEALDQFHALWHLDEMRVAFRAALPQSHLAFFRSLALHHTEGDYAFVHAGFRPGVAIDRQSADDQMWIRDEFLFSDMDFGAFVVHGHTQNPTVVVRENRIGIDTMAYRSGCLTCLVLEGTDRRFLST